MTFRMRAQRRAFDRQVRRMLLYGDAGQQDLARLVANDGVLGDLVYSGCVERYIEQGGAVVALDEHSQVPILDRLLEFFQWLWESGALIEIIKLFLGGLEVAEAEALRFRPQK